MAEGMVFLGGGFGATNVGTYWRVSTKKGRFG